MNVYDEGFLKLCFRIFGCMFLWIFFLLCSILFIFLDKNECLNFNVCFNGGICININGGY